MCFDLCVRCIERQRSIKVYECNVILCNHLQRELKNQLADSIYSRSPYIIMVDLHLDSQGHYIHTLPWISVLL